MNTFGLKVLFDASAKEFNNNIFEGSLVCKSLGTLSDQLANEKSFHEQVKIILNWILRKAANSNCIKVLNQMHHLFYGQNLNETTVKKLCNEFNLSDRQVRRLSAEWLGMNTESFLGYSKYITALNLLHNTASSLTQIGLEAGYYDQSHFIREFKSFTELTPKAYQQLAGGLPGHIIG